MVKPRPSRVPAMAKRPAEANRLYGRIRRSGSRDGQGQAASHGQPAGQGQAGGQDQAAGKGQPTGPARIRRSGSRDRSGPSCRSRQPAGEGQAGGQDQAAGKANRLDRRIRRSGSRDRSGPSCRSRPTGRRRPSRRPGTKRPAKANRLDRPNQAARTRLRGALSHGGGAGHDPGEKTPDPKAVSTLPTGASCGIGGDGSGQSAGGDRRGPRHGTTLRYDAARGNAACGGNRASGGCALTTCSWNVFRRLDARGWSDTSRTSARRSAAQRRSLRRGPHRAVYSTGKGADRRREPTSPALRPDPAIDERELRRQVDEFRGAGSRDPRELQKVIVGPGSADVATSDGPIPAKVTYCSKVRRDWARRCCCERYRKC